MFAVATGLNRPFQRSAPRDQPAFLAGRRWSLDGGSNPKIPNPNCGTFGKPGNSISRNLNWNPACRSPQGGGSTALTRWTLWQNQPLGTVSSLFVRCVSPRPLAVVAVVVVVEVEIEEVDAGSRSSSSRRRRASSSRRRSRTSRSRCRSRSRSRSSSSSSSRSSSRSSSSSSRRSSSSSTSSRVVAARAVVDPAEDLDLLLPGMPRRDAPPQLTPRTVAAIVEGRHAEERAKSKESK